MIVRGPRHDRHFTILDNAVLRDERLTLSARGLLGYLLSQPPGYRVSCLTLHEAPGMPSKNTVVGLLRELEIAGYLIRRRMNDPATGKLDWISTIYEVPQDPTSAQNLGNGLTSTNGAKAQVSTSAQNLGNGSLLIEETEVLSPLRESALVAKRTTKAPDYLWEAMIQACGIDQVSITQPARKAYNTAVETLRKVAATPEEVNRRAINYQVRFEGASLTPSALARHWAECDTIPPRLNGTAGAILRTMSTPGGNLL